MSRTDWNKTPYAGTTASGSEADISRLFDKYGCTDRAIAEYTDPNGSTMFCVRFKLKGQFYKLTLGTLSAHNTTRDELVRQAKRATFYALKSLFELQSVFLPLNVVLLPYAELEGDPHGRVLKDVMDVAINLPKLIPALLDVPALPAADRKD